MSSRIFGFVSLVLSVLLAIEGCTCFVFPMGSETRAMVEQHTVAIATFYDLEPAAAERLRQKRSRRATDEALEYWQIAFPLPKLTSAQTVIFLGSGTVVQGEYVLTVSHLFDDLEGQISRTIWVMKKGLDRPIQADLVCKTDYSAEETFWNDYAVVKLREPLGLPGIRVARTDLLPGDPVLFSGNVGGMAFFSRFGYVTQFRQFFTRKDDGKFHLSFWTDFPFWTVYPSGPGDSGGGVFNTRGELVTIMYCGMEVYAESYVFGNPLEKLWDFLKAMKLEKLG